MTNLTTVQPISPTTQNVSLPQVQKFLDDMKATSASRFNAAKRLEANDSKLTWITAMTSAYIIALTVLPYFLKLPQRAMDSLNFTTAAFSVIILVSTLLHNSKGDAVSAENHHRSALEIKEIYRKVFACGNTLTLVDLLSYVDRYSAVLQKYSVNHNDLDYKKFQIDRPEQFAYLGKLHWFRTRIQLLIGNYVQTMYLVVITLICLWLVFGYALPLRINE